MYYIVESYTPTFGGKWKWMKGFYCKTPADALDAAKMLRECGRAVRYSRG